IPFLHKVITSAAFSDLPIDTQFIEKNEQVLFSQDYDRNKILAIASCAKIISEMAISDASSAVSPFASASQWRMNQTSNRDVHWLNAKQNDSATEQIDTVTVNETQAALPSSAGFSSKTRDFNVSIAQQQYSIQATLQGDQLIACVNGEQIKLHMFIKNLQLNLFYAGLAIELHQVDFSGDAESDHHQGALTAPMNGRVIAVLVKDGDTVSKGDPLIIIEAMKMEHTITALEDGVVADVFYAQAELVAEGDILIAMQSDEEEGK
ncbi:MAG: biotin/lipoyl-containing protein, partial [Oceanospirillaceae bacterium]